MSVDGTTADENDPIRGRGSFDKALRAARLLAARRLYPIVTATAETRAVADGGIYACPILAGLPGARMAGERLADALGPVPLYHPACRTCYETGLTCGNL